MSVSLMKKQSWNVLTFRDKSMYADLEDFALDVAKYYHERENFEKASAYFLKVEETRQQIQGGVKLYEIEV